jgi:NAD(P)-dependent dehydrogenase (short-subunit alcohol dehydrogenase family)
MNQGTILVTGANRGIGLALVAQLKKDGWHVIAACRNPDGAERLKTLGVPILALDVNDENSINKAVAQLSALDVLVNNAAVFPENGDESLEEMKLEWFREAFETNVLGVVRMTRALLPLLRKSRHPRIVNISSGAGSISDKDDHAYYAYSTSKAALNMVTRAIAAEYKPHGVCVVAMSPGWVQTEMGGPHAPLLPEESASAIAATIRRLEMKHSSHFIDRNGRDAEYSW